MIKKWRNRFIIWILVTVFLTVIGVYFYKNVVDTNKRMERLEKEGTRVEADIKRGGDDYKSDDGKYTWEYSLYIGDNKYEGYTMSKYTKAECDQMNNKIWVYYLRDGEDMIIFDEYYVKEGFTPWQPSMSIFLWIIASITFACAAYYVGRNIHLIYILKKGEESIGMFEEAVHVSSRYYKVKYTFVRDGEQVTAISPAYYDGKEVDTLKSYGSFVVRYIGKRSVIDQKL